MLLCLIKISLIYWSLDAVVLSVLPAFAFENLSTVHSPL